MPVGEKLQEQAQDQDTRKAIALTFAFLKRREIDQNAIAQRLGVGHQIISMVKTGKRSPSMRQVEMLSQLAHDALHAGTLDAEEFKLAEELTLAWWHAIHAQMQAVSALKQHVSRQLSSLQTDAQLTPEDLERIAAYAAETLRLSMGLRHLAELGKTWQVVGTRLVETWERIKRERYPDGAPTIQPERHTPDTPQRCTHACIERRAIMPEEMANKDAVLKEVLETLEQATRRVRALLTPEPPKRKQKLHYGFKPNGDFDIRFVDEEK